MNDGMILTARVDNIEHIKFTGVVRYSHCSGLELHIDHLFQDADFTEIIVDLEDAEILDSTALGLLARIAIEHRKISTNKPVIFVHTGELSQILSRVCFDQVFSILVSNSDRQDAKFVELRALPQDENQVLESVIKAHRSLASLNEQNQGLFRDITGSIT